jgi:hypothetical protein
VSIIFRDENSRVIRRIDGNAGNKAVSTTHPLQIRSTFIAHGGLQRRICSEGQMHGTTRSLLQPTLQPGRDEAICLFRRLCPWQIASTRFVDWKIGSSAHRSALIEAMSAVGLAVLSSTRNSPPLKLAARKEYATALREVNKTLARGSTPISDVTFALIILMALFEVRVLLRPTPWDPWLNT